MFHTGKFNKIPLRKRSSKNGDLCLFPKLPRHEMPKNFQPRIEPLYSLPSELLHLSFESSTKKSSSLYIKKRNNKRHEKLMKSYTALRKAREEFREKLVRLIVQDVSTKDDNCIPSRHERKILRYYYYLKHGIETVHVAPLDNKILIRVHNLLSPKLKQWDKILKQETEDMKEDFMMSMKKAIVDFVLRDPDMIEPLEVPSTSARAELKNRDDQWNNRYQRAKLLLGKNLHSINPCIAQVLDIWWKQFNDLRLINLQEIISEKVVYNVMEFEVICKQHIDKTINILNTQWLPTIQNIFLQGSKKKMIPCPNQPKKMKKFYDCLSCIMTYNLQTLCLKSIRAYTNYILDVGGINQGLYISIIFKNSIIAFDPPFKKIKEVLLNLYELLIDACKIIPRLETQIYKDYSGEIEFLKPVIDMEYIEECKFKVHELLDDQRIGPELQVQDFDEYIDLINGKMTVEVDNFLKAEPPKKFNEYCSFAEKLVKVASDIPMKLQKVVVIGIYKMERENLINALKDAATSFANRLLDRMTTDYQTKIKEFGEEYLSISNVLLTAPLNTAALMELKLYSVEVEDKILVEMERKLKFVMDYITFLSDYTTFTPLEMKANNNTFQWYARMPNVLEECRQMCNEKTLEYQEALKVRINKFVSDLARMAKQVEELKFWGSLDQLHKYVTRANALNEKLNTALTTINQFNVEEKSFEWEQSQYILRKQIYDKLSPYKKLYDSAFDYIRKNHDWMSSKVGSYDPEEIDSNVTNYYKTVYKLETIFNDIPDAYHLANDVRLKIEEFKEHLPVVHTLGNPGMKIRHWERVSEIVGFPIVIDDSLTLEKIIDYGLTEYLTKFEVISEAATKENILEQNLDKMMSEWEELVFKIHSYRDSGTYILAGVDEIQILLDDHIVKTQTMKNSPYIKPFEETILAWEAKLQLLQEIMDEWLHVQSTWMYLEPIFSSPDIQQQMPEEGRKFSAVDKMWREIMKAVFAEPRVLDVIEIEKLLERLKKSNSLLEIIQRGLNVYLEKKRLFFPRFFFLSNDELLEILSETKDPTRVQPNLKKCFEGIAKLNFSEDLTITHIKSSEDEIIPLEVPVNTAIAKGQVEKWLLDLEIAMKSAIHNTILLAFDAYSTTKREQWVFDWAGQLIQCVAMTYWTSEVSEAIEEGKSKLESYLESYNEKITGIIELLSRDLTIQNRITLGALVVLDIHARDVISELISLNVNAKNDFNWLCQLRYYLESQEDSSMKMCIKMINSTLIYGCEYLGNTSRLVITPLTTRCFRILFGTIRLHLSGALEGPAGTGKTETVKDLSRALAKQCVIFNCSAGLDYISLGKFLKGLASCGAWSCFDDFNRIDLEVLSVAAQQMLTIYRGLVTKSTEFVMDGISLQLDSTCAVFVSMNPGYVGRTKLPDNLKVLFRSVAMMVPDYAQIAEIELYASGYSNAKQLASKIVTTYRLCAERLSNQCYYDFGMRAVKSVLKAAAILRMKHQDQSEETIILRSIKDINLPKFLHQDVELFMRIISDIFPDVPTHTSDLTDLTTCLQEAYKSLNLQSTPYMMDKAIQLYEMSLIRHGLMIVGFPFSGKSSVYKGLAKALCIANEKKLMNENKVQYTVINPKAISLGQLYGQFDPVSHDWTDGILPVTYRAYSLSTTPNRKWLIFDGPIDTVWIENLNTVLDDNKKLCLMSGEIIHLAPTTNIIFETMHLDAASPATISRCGIIYMQSSILGWEPLMESWLNTLPSSLNATNLQIIRQLFRRFCPPLLWLLREGGVKEMHKSTNSNLVWSATNVFDTFTDDFLDEKYMSSHDDLDIRAQIEGVFFFSIIWSLGATLESSSRPKFDSMFRGLLEKEFPQDVVQKLGYPHQINKPEKNYIFTIPKDGLVYDYRYIKEGKGKWKPWSDELLSAPPIPRDIIAHSIIVSTIDTIRYLTLFKLLVGHKKDVMMVGPTGTGKTSYIVDFLTKKIDTKIYKSLIMGFSSQTTAKITQDIIMAKLDKRKKGVFGPSIGTQCVIFVDDVSMPQIEEYGAQPPIEILRQALDQKLWYDRKDNSAMKLIDMQFMCAMRKPLPGSRGITPRFTRHFNFLCIDDFDDPTLMLIFSKIMLWHLDTRGFSKEFDPCIEELVSATLNIYKLCKLNLLPTPEKSHYVFNLRDFARVIQGVLLSVPEVIEDLQAMKRLWVNECMRVFLDRLIDANDKDWFVETLRSATSKYLHIDFDNLLERLLEKPNNKVTHVDLRKLMYCDFANPKAADTKHYMEIPDLDHMTKTVDSFLFEFNNMTKKPMSLVLFRFAVEHVVRICRIIGQPRSHALLIGLSGSGKQSLTRLAGHINDHELFQVEINKQYNYNSWREDLKNMFRKASTPDQHVTFLFNELQGKDEIFLDDVNCILNSGEIPNLFNPEEKADLCELMRVIDKQRDKSIQTDGTPIALLDLFANIAREQLHIVLTMSPAGSLLKTRIRKFPAIINCCTIDWFEEWPSDALLAIAAHFLKDINLTDSEKSSITHICQEYYSDIKELSVEYHIRSQRYNYVTPTAYLEMLSLYKTLLTSKRLEVTNGEKRYLSGIEQLEKTAKSVNELQKLLEELQPKLAENITNVTEITAQIITEKENVANVEELVFTDQEVADDHAKAVQVIKEECDANYAEAIPIMETASAALQILTPADIALVKTMKNPPKGVKLVMEAVCLLKGMKSEKSSGTEDYWGLSKKMLNDPKFLESLLLFDKDNIPAHVVARIQSSILQDELFNPEKIKQSSVAAEVMCRWVISVIKYDEVIKLIAPKKQTLADAQTELNKAMATLQAKQSQLKEVRDKLENLERQLEEYEKQQKMLEENVELCGNKLTRAEQILKGLGGEKVKWTEAAKSLRDLYPLLTGNILISAGIIAFLGPFTSLFRNPCIKKWTDKCTEMGLLCSNNFKLYEVLGEPVCMQQWHLDGLPIDDFSIESALIVKNSRRWPLIIDPQGQANCWIKDMEKPFHLNIVKMTQADFSRVLENAVQFGQPVILENVGEELDPLLETLLQQQMFRQGTAMYIKLGESVIEYNKNFRFYITTKLQNPSYSPGIAVRVTLVNFALGSEGLSNQLLEKVVAQERPELQQAKSDITLQSAEHNKTLKEIEEKILMVLSSSQTLLEDEAAVQTLHTSKITANDINDKQMVAVETEVQLDKARKQYEPIAFYATTLFFLTDDLSKINTMYQYSLEWFETLFNAAIDNTDRVDDVNQRQKDLREYFTHSFYLSVCRSLFDKDKLIFSLLLTVNIQIHDNNFDITELQFFLTNADALLDKPCPFEFLGEKSWNEINRLDGYKAFEGIIESIKKDVQEWENYINLADPQMSALPQPWETKLSFFQKLLLIKCMRQDKIIPAVRLFVENTIGSKFIEPPAFNLELSFADSHCRTPLVFILSAGFDPMDVLHKFVDDQGFGEKFFSFSLGQGQGPVAMKVLDEAIRTGYWVVLQNCHLAKSWMPALEKIFDSLLPETTHTDFRLWLTSYPDEFFPNAILQSSIKITNEPPQDLRDNILWSFQSNLTSNAKWFENNDQIETYKKVLYSLYFFHGIVQERRLFGSLGWNIPYEFNEIDLKINITETYMFLNEYEKIQFSALQYLISECIYGGRITDAWDQRCFQTILKKYCDAVVISESPYKLESTGTYLIPDVKEQSEFIKFIKNLPLYTYPEVLGMNENANFSKHLRESNAFLETTLLTQDRSDLLDKYKETMSFGETGVSSDEEVKIMSEEVLTRLPRTVFTGNPHESETEISKMSPIAIVLMQEGTLYSQLLNVVRTSLNAVIEGIKGTNILTDVTEKVLSDIAHGKTPEYWLQNSYPSLKLFPSYVDDLLERLQFLQNWYENGPPTVYWISGLYSPQAFLTAILQTHVDKYNVSIDDLTFDFQVQSMNNLETSPENGVYIKGLFMEGARWNNESNVIDEVLPRTSYDTFPTIWLIPIKKCDSLPSLSYDCPLYKTADRRGALSTTGHSANYITCIKLPTEKNPDHWIVRGVALLTQLPY